MSLARSKYLQRRADLSVGALNTSLNTEWISSFSGMRKGLSLDFLVTVYPNYTKILIITSALYHDMEKRNGIITHNV